MKTGPRHIPPVLVLFVPVALLIIIQACAGVPSSLSGNTGSGTPPSVSSTPPPVNAAIGVFTFHNDNARTGLNSQETVLTKANVTVSSFGRKFSYPVDGVVLAQPLYLSNVAVPGVGTFDAVFVATAHDSVYAFDAKGAQNGPLWKTSFLGGANNATTVPQADVGSTIYPEVGITSTPVIDPVAKTIYVEAITKETGNYVHRLHALDLTNGKEKTGSPVVISGGAGGVTFVPEIELQRPGLLLANGKVYLAFGSEGDNGPYHGWIFAYDAATLSQSAVWCVTPDSNGGAIWMAGGGPAADSSGNIYVLTANGGFNAASGGHSYSDSFVKLAPDLSVLDFFTPFDEQNLALTDTDIGSVGPLLLPDQSGAHAHLVVGSGKSGAIYLVDRDSMGHFNKTDNSQIVQALANAVGTGTEDLNFSSPAYWNGNIYYVGATDSLKQFTLSNGQIALTGKGSATYDYRGATPAVSSNGLNDAIVWTIQRNGDNSTLRANDASNVAVELYNSNQNQGRDGLDITEQFAVPTIFNGTVYIGTKKNLVAYGLQ